MLWCPFKLWLHFFWNQDLPAWRLFLVLSVFGLDKIQTGFGLEFSLCDGFAVDEVGSGWKIRFSKAGFRNRFGFFNFFLFFADSFTSHWNLVDLVGIGDKLFVGIDRLISGINSLEFSKMFLLKFSLLLNRLNFFILPFLGGKFYFFTSDNSLLACFFLHFNNLIFIFFSDVHNSESIFYIVELDK